MDTALNATLKLAPTHGETGRGIAFLADEVKHFNDLFMTQGGSFKLLHVRLAVDEALLNAIEHGTRQRKEAIWLSFRLTPTVLEISVEDPGDGFEHFQFKESTAKDLGRVMSRTHTRSKGWGLAIIQSVTQSMFWNTRGNRITMLFYAQ